MRLNINVNISACFENLEAELVFHNNRNTDNFLTDLERQMISELRSQIRDQVEKQHPEFVDAGEYKDAVAYLMGQFDWAGDHYEPYEEANLTKAKECLEKLEQLNEKHGLDHRDCVKQLLEGVKEEFLK